MEIPVLFQTIMLLKEIRAMKITSFVLILILCKNILYLKNLRCMLGYRHKNMLYRFKLIDVTK